MWRSLVAHLFWEQRVAGSNPVIPTDSSRSDHLVRAAFSCSESEALTPFHQEKHQPRGWWDDAITRVVAWCRLFRRSEGTQR